MGKINAVKDGHLMLPGVFRDAVTPDTAVTYEAVLL